MRIFNLDSVDDSCDVQVYLPGPPGPPLTIVGSRSGEPGPAEITTTIAAPISRRQLSFIVGSGGPINQPSIPNPPDNGPWEFGLFATDDTDTITLNDAANIQLSGQWIGMSGSILWLFWDGVSKYVEDRRNEI
jgi:hypothetical protein